jgi:hypothetical protein
MKGVSLRSFSSLSLSLLIPRFIFFSYSYSVPPQTPSSILIPSHLSILLPVLLLSLSFITTHLHDPFFSTVLFSFDYPFLLETEMNAMLSLLESCCQLVAEEVRGTVKHQVGERHL